jgi:hypothetical protein
MQQRILHCIAGESIEIEAEVQLPAISWRFSK